MAELTTTERYRAILQRVTAEHAALGAKPGQPESLALCDPQTDNYLLLDTGWEATGRVHYVVFHLRLKDGQVWIETDGIEYGIAQDLMAAGIPASDIRLAQDTPQAVSFPVLRAA